MSITIGDVAIGGDNPCRFVAELSNNHNGDLVQMIRLIDEAKRAGADFVKTQAFDVQELIDLRGDGPAPSQWADRSMRDLYTQARTPLEWLPAISSHCRAVGLPWFTSVFGFDSVLSAVGAGTQAVKIARLDNWSTTLWSHVTKVTQRLGVPLIVSLAADQTPLNPQPDFTLYCPPDYPQSTFSFSRISFVGRSCSDDDAFGGFSFHGTDAMPCVVAATLGAKLIEAHFQLDDEPSELEANVSLTASQFRHMVDEVRKVEAMLA